MGILDWFKDNKDKAEKLGEPKKTAKEIATESGEPYVEVLNLDLDPDNPGSGVFELDWNEQFIKELWKAGYRDEKQEDMVDRWFQDICRNIVLESYEKEQADPTNRYINRRDLGNGRTEVS